MTVTPEQAAVEELKSRLGEAEQTAAALRQRAEDAAKELIADPSREIQRERDEWSSQAELASLTAARLCRDLAEAEQADRAEQRLELIQEHAGAQSEVAVLEGAARAGVGQAEDSLNAILGHRTATRRRLARLRALGFDGETLQLNLPHSHELVRRIERLVELYRKCTHPVMG